MVELPLVGHVVGCWVVVEGSVFVAVAELPTVGSVAGCWAAVVCSVDAGGWAVVLLCGRVWWAGQGVVLCRYADGPAL